MKIWQRIGRGLRSFGAKVRSIFAGKEPKLLEPAKPSGALDVRSYDLGDRTGWLQRSNTYTRFDEIQQAIVSDSLLLRAMFLPEQLGRQGGYTLEPAKGATLSERKAQLALRDVQEFCERIVTPYNEGFDELFFRSAGELARYSNLAIELVYQDGELANAAMLPWISMNLQVDKQGLPIHWVQFDLLLHRVKFELWQICHGVTCRQAGDRYGTPMLEPTAGDSGDLKAYHALESLFGQYYQHFIFPTRLIKFGSPEYPETNEAKMAANRALVEEMYREGVLIGSGRESLESDAPEGLDSSPILKYWKQRVVQATGFSLVRLGEAGDVNVATAEVIESIESQNQMATMLATADSFRRGIFVPFLEARGIPRQYAPRIVPGEPNPVRRQKFGIYMADLFATYGVATQDEARVANGLQPLTLPPEPDDTLPPEPDDSAPDNSDDAGMEPQERHEERAEDRSK